MTTWMAREVEETPLVVERAIRDGASDIEAAAGAIARFGPRWVSFVARGSSDHVATYGRYLVEVKTGLPTSLAAPAVTTVYDAAIRWTGGLVVAISQSGRSPDLVAVIEAARAGGALTLVVTNEIASPLAVAGDLVLPCRAGPEHAVAATKTYTACLVTVASLVAEMTRSAELRDGLAGLPDVLRRSLDLAGTWVRESGVVEAFSASDRSLIASRGYDLATALEVAIKLQETAGVFAIGHSTADLEHGPVALAGMEIPVLAVRPDGPAGRRIDGALERVRATRAHPWIVGGQEAPILPGDSDHGRRSLRLPLEIPHALAPAALILPGQLLAEAVARARGRDPDQPAGLTKVTLTH